VQAEEGKHVIGRNRVQDAVGALDLDAGEAVALEDQCFGQPLDELQATLCLELAHLRDGRRGGTELGTPVHEGQRRRGRRELDRPVERRIPAPEDEQMLAAVVRRAPDPVVDLRALEGLAARHADAPRLEGAHARCDHDGAGVEHRPGGRGDAEAPVGLRRHLEDFLAEVELQRRDVVDRLVRIEFGALPAGRLERIEDMGLDPEQPEFEDLEQPAGARADDHHVGTEGRGLGGGGIRRGGQGEILVGGQESG